MTKQEFKMIVFILETTYDKFKISDDKNKMQIYYEMLGDLEFKECEVAVKKLIAGSPYVPAISDIRKRAVEVSTPQNNLLDLWNEALKAMKNGIYMTKEEFQKLSPLVQKFFGGVTNVKDYSIMEIDKIQSVTKGQFEKQVGAMLQKEKSELRLPQSLRNEIAQNDIEKLTNRVIKGLEGMNI